MSPTRQTQQPPAKVLEFDPSAPPASTDAESCPFCAISRAFPPYDPTSPPPPGSPSINPDKLSPASYVVLSTPTLLAFLDIMPLSPGHLLLCPRTHRPKLTDVSPSEAADLGKHLRLLSRALCRTTGVMDWNVVQNNGAAAAQVVNHVHYHLIPRPEIRASGRFSESFTMFGRGVRTDLDDDEAADLAGRLREEVKKVLDEENGRGKL
ncbi:HIT-like domain-containing protein [Microdochium trichocladiopsis]|uniref:HIT-like domain-containing protein n=1 Tax=Microdochium trichocladiopsis TaxID=1682393 RepID=A0A9P9BT61_9PEZI|nr:HIT-like domain-containing protein [Microdochium trichocladiopsis]KAH7039641.1 HIT-like domain-containing protein [Microdochium trichocladiopsis]